MLDPHALPEWRALLDVPPRPAWMLRAACRNARTSAFYVAGLDAAGRARALAICERCEVRQPCLNYALRHDEVGIWGGMTTRQRRLLAARAG